MSFNAILCKKKIIQKWNKIIFPLSGGYQWASVSRQTLRDPPVEIVSFTCHISYCSYLLHPLTCVQSPWKPTFVLANVLHLMGINSNPDTASAADPLLWHLGGRMLANSIKLHPAGQRRRYGVRRKQKHSSLVFAAVNDMFKFPKAGCNVAPLVATLQRLALLSCCKKSLSLNQGHDLSAFVLPGLSLNMLGYPSGKWSLFISLRFVWISDCSCDDWLMAIGPSYFHLQLLSESKQTTSHTRPAGLPPL